MKIILIGGAGFVGSHLFKTLQGNAVVLDKRLEGSNYCDITIRSTLEGKINGDSIVVLLAAEHRDDVSPVANYYKTNVEGTKNVLSVMDQVGCKHLIFTSSVAVYGLNKENPDEDHTLDPFNHYGKSKMEAERTIRSWYEQDIEERIVTIVRPTVIFGEQNRGNVYNLLNQIVNRKFILIGSGSNEKSMAYVGNVVAFICYRIQLKEIGFHTVNYVDKPDLTIKDLISIVEDVLKIKVPSIEIPVSVGLFFGYVFDIVALATGRKTTISSVRVKKFIATTKYSSIRVQKTFFVAPFTLMEGIVRTLNHEFKGN